MEKEKNNKSVWKAGAAIAACGAALYGARQLLSFLFRDVDPERIKEEPAKEPEAIEDEED